MATCYEVYYRDYRVKKAEMLGALAERRKHPRRHGDLMQSALKWARREFGQHVRDANAIYVLRKEWNID